MSSSTCKSCGGGCGTCDSQRLKPNPVNSLPPRNEYQSVGWTIRDVHREIFKRVYISMKSQQFSRLRIRKFLNNVFLKIV